MQRYMCEQDIMMDASCGCVIFPVMGFSAGFIFSILEKLDLTYQFKCAGIGAGIAAGMFSCFLLARLSLIPRDREAVRVHFERSGELYRRCMRFGFFRPQEPPQGDYERVEQNNLRLEI